MTALTLGILAHVDAGKTTLTEQLLHAAGVIDEPGSVDAGSTRTDVLDLERRRGITIASAVVSFDVGGVTVDLVDTPGHPDFIAEVERVLGILDGAVLVVSAVEGVQPQTRVLMRALRRLQIPTLVFVNKVDRVGADVDRVVAQATARLSSGVVPTWSDDALAEVLTRHDDALLAAWVDGGERLGPARLQESLVEQTARCRVHPVLTGSAIRGDGVAELLQAIPRLLPAGRGEANGPVGGRVFKVVRERDGARVALVRLWSGTVRPRDLLPYGDGRTARVTAVGTSAGGVSVPADALAAGRVGRVHGLEGVRIGDGVGPAGRPDDTHHFAPPALETVFAPRRPQDAGALHVALVQIAEQDPLIGLRRDDVRGETTVSLYGEVQREVIEATLAEEHGLEVEVRSTTTVCLERPIGSGSAVHRIDTPPNPFLATVGLRVDPASRGAGVGFVLEVELGAMPAAFFHAVEESVHRTLAQGAHGWEVVDCVVTMTHSGYWPRQSSAHGVFDKAMSSTGRDFRHLTPLVLVDALRRAGSQVLEPVDRFELEAPTDTLDHVLGAVARHGGTSEPPRVHGQDALMTGTLPTAAVTDLRRRLPSLTRGEGVLECRFDHHRPVRGPSPTRRRTAPDPWHRASYLLEVDRHVPTG